MTETQGVAQWIYTTLTNSPAIGSAVGARVYEDHAPEVVTRPFICYQLVSSFDNLVCGTAHAGTEQEWFVYGVCQSQSYVTVDNIASLIDAALNGVVGGTAVTGMTVTCRRTEAMRYTHVEDGKTWKYAGGYYRVFAGTT